MKQRLMKPEEVAEILVVSEATLATWRCLGRGQIPFVKIGKGRVRYRSADIESFVARNLCMPLGATL